MDTTKVIEVKDLVKRFRLPSENPFKSKFDTIINGMTFSIEPGNHVAIIGANGSGKTTLMKILAGIYLPDAGTVKIRGYDVEKQLHHVLEHVSFVSPALSFLKKLTLRDIINFYGKAQGKDPEPALKFIELFGITHMLDELLEVFSEGQKAMTRFAIALLKEPDVMLIDEVTANLDVVRKEKLLNFLAERKDKITYIIIDHDVSTVDRLTNKILLLRRGGTVLRLGDVETILKTIPYKYDVDVIPKHILPDDYWNEYDQPYRQVGSHVQFICQDEKEVRAVSDRLIRDPEVISYTTSSLSIEDIYYFYLINEDYRSSEGLGRISYDESTAL